MARKKNLNQKNQTTKADHSALQSEMNRENKIMNSMINVSVILMSTMMCAFTNVMMNATSSLASGMAEAVGGKENGDKVNEEIKQNLPEVDAKMKAMISDIRRDIYAQMRQKKQEMKLMFSDPVFDIGPKIIEKYDFKLPKLSQKLNDNELAQYSKLLVNEDLRFVKMFKELTQWINSLPKPSGANHWYRCKTT